MVSGTFLWVGGRGRAPRSQGFLDTTASSSHSGLSTTVTDAAGNPRTLVSDARGKQVRYRFSLKELEPPRHQEVQGMKTWHSFCLDHSGQWV